MELKLNLDRDKIVDKEFKGKKAGYDALEVDKFLDLIVQDYLQFENYIKELNEKISYTESLLSVLKKKNNKLEMDNEILQAKMESIKDNDQVSLGNLDLLKKISKLEQKCYEAGISIEDIDK